MHESDEALVRRTRNTARFFAENRHVAWVVLVATLAWGVFGYWKMPKRKDPQIPIRIGAVVCPWPGQPAAKVEDRVTKRLEETVALNGNVERIFSTTRNSVAVLVVVLDARIDDIDKELEDIQGKLGQVRDLPEGAGPIQFVKDYKDTSALMLTVASPTVPPVEIGIRADGLRKALEDVRGPQSAVRSPGAETGATGGSPDPSVRGPQSRTADRRLQTADGLLPRATLLVGFPFTLDPGALGRVMEGFPAFLRSRGQAGDGRVVRRPGFLAVDADFAGTDAEFLDAYEAFVRERLARADLHPDVWRPVVVRDLADAEARLASVAGPRYTHRDLDGFTEGIVRALSNVPEVAKVARVGVLGEAVYLTWSQDRLAAYGLQPSALPTLLSARNTTIPGGILESGDRNVIVEPGGEFRDESDLGGVMLGASPRGAPMYLRDVFDVAREYQNPPRFLNFYTHRDARGDWQRTRAVTLSVLMKPDQQIARFGEAVDEALAKVRGELPEDLVMARTSDQPLQVREHVDLFMRSLWEAVLLIVAVAFLGFREWRSATLMAASIPLTLAMTFGMMHLLHVDIQQVSIATLIIALGLLVDDPVVAGDAIKREVAAGHPPVVAAWLGPTKLANAIVFATLTNIAAYLPLLMMSEDVGKFIWSLPVVMTCSLVSSRIVSMTFVPLLGRLLLRPRDGGKDPRTRTLGRFYRRLVAWAIRRRWWVLAGATVVLAASGALGLKTSFFPTDLSYLFYVDVWLPEDVPLSATGEAARRADELVREAAARFAAGHPGPGGQVRTAAGVLRSITAFVGGGGPRFWFSVIPEMQQLNYAQLVVQMEDKRDTEAFVGPLQEALTAGMPGALVDVRRLETAKPVGVPVSFRLMGDDAAVLKAAGERVKTILRDSPLSVRVREDWGAESLAVRLEVDPDRANLAGLTNLDVALSSVSGVNGFQVATLADGRRHLPVSVRLRAEERARLEDLDDFYVYSVREAKRVPLASVATPSIAMEPERIKRRNQFRTLTVAAFPANGFLPSELLNDVRARVDEVARSLPPGHRLEIGGESEEQVKSFREIAVVMAASVLLIFLMLTLEFRHAAKPLIVFAAIPFGLAGAVVSLWAAGAPFGFMAFLGCASLIGVIVSHVIVLFDYVEVLHERGVPFQDALAEAGILRMRPVMITVGATVLGLIPLALHGGPLWEPMCYAQIGGLTVATAITLLLVPVIYAVFVLDLKIVRWQGSAPDAPLTPSAAAAAGTPPPG